MDETQVLAAVVFGWSVEHEALEAVCAELGLLVDFATGTELPEMQQITFVFFSN